MTELRDEIAAQITTVTDMIRADQTKVVDAILAIPEIKRALRIARVVDNLPLKEEVVRFDDPNTVADFQRFLGAKQYNDLITGLRRTTGI